MEAADWSNDMAKKRVTLQTIHAELQDIKKQLSRIQDTEEKELEAIQHEEERELEALKGLEELEQEIKREVGPHPLAKITYRDVTKGMIGAFFGIVGHFAFFYGNRIAEAITILRAHALILTSLGLLILFMYFTGFRSISKGKHWWYAPLRIVIIFTVAHAVITFVLFLFGMITPDMTIASIYKNVATVSILAVMGAATADLIGGDHHE